jgi:hypothetical protein
LANGILYEMILSYKDSQLKPTMRCLDREFKPKKKRKKERRGKMYTESPAPSPPSSKQRRAAHSTGNRREAALNASADHAW